MGRATASACTPPQRASTDSMRHMFETLRADLARVRDGNRIACGQLVQDLGAPRLQSRHGSFFGGDMSTPSTPVSTGDSSG